MAVSAAPPEGYTPQDLIDAVVDHAGKVEILLLGRLARPGQLGDLLFDRAFDVDQLGVGTMPAVELAALHGEVGRHLPGQHLRLHILARMSERSTRKRLSRPLSIASPCSAWNSSSGVLVPRKLSAGEWTCWATRSAHSGVEVSGTICPRANA
jgi:hypothetical protein